MHVNNMRTSFVQSHIFAGVLSHVHEGPCGRAAGSVGKAAGLELPPHVVALQAAPFPLAV